MMSISARYLAEISPCDLNDIVLFRGLPETQLRQLNDLLRRKRFVAGTTLMTHDQAGEVVYFIIRGTVKIHVEQPGGDDVIIAIAGPGESIGEMSALDQTARSATVVTLEETELLWLDRETLRRCLMAMPVLGYNLACVLSSRLRHANEQIQSLATLEAEQRIARHLLAFAEKYGRRQANHDLLIPIRLTQSDIAALTGASREHTNKILVSYKERGYLSCDRRHHLTIHNLSAIAKRG